MPAATPSATAGAVLHAPAAVDILAAAPVLSATTLAASLGIAQKNAGRLLETFTILGIAVEVTHRSKRRLYGLKHLAPLRETTAPAGVRPLIPRGPGRPREITSVSDEAIPPPPSARIAPSPPLPRVALDPFEFTELDGWMAIAEEAICGAAGGGQGATRRAQAGQSVGKRRWKGWEERSWLLRLKGAPPTWLLTGLRIRSRAGNRTE